MVTALINMYLLAFTCFSKTRRIKIILTWINFLSGLLATCFYFHHNLYCQSGTYTLFAVSEYIVLLSNIGFHFQAYYDFQNYRLCLIDKRTEQLP